MFKKTTYFISNIFGGTLGPNVGGQQKLGKIEKFQKNPPNYKMCLKFQLNRRWSFLDPYILVKMNIFNFIFNLVNTDLI